MALANLVALANLEVGIDANYVGIRTPARPGFPRSALARRLLFLDDDGSTFPLTFRSYSGLQSGSPLPIIAQFCPRALEPNR